jgi:hypothetical protein
MVNPWFNRFLKSFLIVLVLGQGSVSLVSAQFTRHYAYTGANYGFLMPHHDYMRYFLQEHVRGIDARWGMQLSGQQFWHLHYNLPVMGVGVYHGTTGNQDIFGRLTGVYGFVDRKFLPVHYPINLSSVFDCGLGFLSKVYDIGKNPYNVAIGSRVNVFLRYQVNLEYRLSRNIMLSAGLAFLHTSNGRFREPNQGLNMVMLNSGLRMGFNRVGHSQRSRVDSMNYAPRRFQVHLLTGWKESSRLYPGVSWVQGLALEYSAKVSRRSRVGGGMSVYHDPSKIRHVSGIASEQQNSSEPLRLVTSISYELLMGRLSYILQPGVYLYGANAKYGRACNKIGFRYTFQNNLSLGVSIKAHWIAVADFVEWNMGYAFSL